MSRSRMPYFSFASTTMLRPSGVSSAKDEICAASARAFSSTPLTGKKAVACRLPSVIVPVLSSSSTSTSPAASTARPDTAITLAWIIRSIPAMPMADSSPPIVVGLLSAIGIAGMDRMIQANVIAVSGRAVEAAGDVDVLLLDKTGTITLGNRQATAFFPVSGVDEKALADAAQISSLADETPEGRSIVVLAKEKYGIRERDIHALGATFVPFTAQTRMSGVDLNGRQIRKGAADAIRAYVDQCGGTFPPSVNSIVSDIAKQGATPLVVADGPNILGVIQLKDIVKGGIKERFAELRQMGIKTVMITGDNPLTEIG